MASDSCVSSTITSSRFSSGSTIWTRVTFAGLSAFWANATVSSFERNNVDFFATQFANDRLHAHAFHAHARAHRIHVLVAAFHRDLGPLARFTRYGANLHRAVVDFRNFHFEQTLHQGGVGTGNHHLWPFRRALHGANRYPEPVSHVVGFES